MMVIEALFAVRASEAVPVTEVVALTGFVVIAKVAEEAPAAIVTLAGTLVIDVFELESLTTHPPAGAGPSRTILPVEVDPPTTELGEIVRSVTESSCTSNVALSAPPS